MKRNYMVGIVAVVLSVCLATPYTATANQVNLVSGSGTGSMSVEQLLSSYEAYSVEGRQIRNDLYLASLGEQGAFYTEYTDRISQMRMSSKKYALFSNALELCLLNKQQEYYASCKELTELKSTVVAIKKRFGLSVGTEETELRAEKKSVEKNVQAAQKSKELLVEELREETSLGNDSLGYFFATGAKTYDESTVRYRFINNSEAYLQAGYLGRTYREQEAELQQPTEEPLPEENEVPEENDVPKGDEVAEEDDVPNGDEVPEEDGVPEGDEVAVEGETEQEQQQQIPEEVILKIGALAENYEIQQEVIRKQLEKNAKQVLAAYEENNLNLEAAQSNLFVYEEKYSMECKKFEYGRSTKIAVLESKIAMLGAETEYLQCLVKKAQLEYMLDYGVMAEE